PHDCANSRTADAASGQCRPDADRRENDRGEAGRETEAKAPKGLGPCAGFVGFFDLYPSPLVLSCHDPIPLFRGAEGPLDLLDRLHIGPRVANLVVSRDDNIEQLGIFVLGHGCTPFRCIRLRRMIASRMAEAMTGAAAVGVCDCFSIARQSNATWAGLPLVG